jgi:hypothetical protein
VAWLWLLKPASVAGAWFFGALFVSAFLFWLIFRNYHQQPITSL